MTSGRFRLLSLARIVADRIRRSGRVPRLQTPPSLPPSRFKPSRLLQASKLLPIHHVRLVDKPRHGLLASDAGPDAREAVLLLETRANRRGRSSRSFRVPLDLRGDVLVGGLDGLAPSDVVQHERAAD